MLTFPDVANESPLFWCVSLQCYSSAYNPGLFLNDILKMDELFYLPMMEHTLDQNMSTFFHMCRIKHMHFDFEERQGVLFQIMDGMESRVLGLVAKGQESFEQGMAFLFQNEHSGKELSKVRMMNK